MNGAEPAGERRPRYGAATLPPYSYVPGFTPHPVSDPRGHLYGQEGHATIALDPARWRESDEFLRAVDLFNHGYYWESHESWESLWHAAGRSGPVAVFLKALIKLAAAGVKAREGNPAGVERHSRRALELLAELCETLPESQVTYCGLALTPLRGMARSLAFNSAERFATPQPTLVLSEWLPLGGS
jgi:uncharacterized protein